MRCNDIHFSFCRYSLTQDFMHNATTYGKIIISETFVPDRAKTILPLPSQPDGNIQYYTHKGIVYKAYGHSQSAMSMASNEMKAWRSILRSGVPGLHVPFMIQIDFQGFRLIAQS